MIEWPARLDRPCAAAARRSAARAGASPARSVTTNVAPWPTPGAAHLDLAAVQPHQIVDDRQAEAEPAVAPRRRAVGLPEPIEHVRQKRAVDADAGIGDFDPDALVDLRRR